MTQAQFWIAVLIFFRDSALNLTFLPAIPEFLTSGIGKRHPERRKSLVCRGSRCYRFRWSLRTEVGNQ